MELEAISPPPNETTGASGRPRRIGRLAGTLVGLLFGVAWFIHLVSLPVGYRLRGDASSYLQIAGSFSGFSEALSYLGDRSLGFPLFLYTLLRVIGRGATLQGFLLFAACVMAAIHIAACLAFYACLRQRAECAGRKLHWLLVALLLAHPGLMGHTTVLLADTLCADLLMLAVALLAKNEAASASVFSLTKFGAGALLGAAALCRPSYQPFVIVTLCLVSTLTLVWALRARAEVDWRRASWPALCLAGYAAFVGPTMLHCASRFDEMCLSSPIFQRKGLQGSLQGGRDSVRTYWSSFVRPEETSPFCGSGCRAPRDSFLTTHWVPHCPVDPQRLAGGLAGCFVSRPDLGLVFIAKKVIALFDAYQYQPYATDLTPAWARRWSRPFGMAAGAGVVASAFLVVGFFRRPHIFSAELTLCLLTLGAAFLHALPHVEGRYGFGAVPGALWALFTWLETLLRLPRTKRLVQIAVVAAAALSILIQTSDWDGEDAVLQRLEGAQK